MEPKIMEPKIMTNEESYHFDVAGYLIIPGVLSAAQLTACNQALDQLGPVDGPLQWTGPSANPLLALRDHPVLMQYLEQICGEEFRLDLAPRLIGLADGDPATSLSGGAEWVDWARAYRQHNGQRFCQGVRALWALADVGVGDGGLVVVSASHNSTVDAPQDLVDGDDDMGLVVQPVLQAGDLLLCADSLMRGLRPWHGAGPQRLLECGYISAGVRPCANSVLRGEESEMPEWTAELTEVQRAVLHNPNRPYPPRVVRSDGKATWLEEEPGVYHPSLYCRDPNSGIDEKEFFHWDLCGHLVLRGVMDEEWLAAANEAIDANPDRISTGGSAAGDSTPLAGSGVGRSSMGDPWTLPGSYGEPFRRMIADPVLIQRLNWMMGSGFECMQCSGFLSAKGSSGHSLHAAGEPARVTNHYRQQNGRIYSAYLNVAWQLRDVTLEDGGFVCVPGSHKTCYPMPEGIKTCDDEMGLVRHVAMKAGDVLLFLGSAQTHGAYPWMGEQNRRMIFFQYRPRDLYAP
jgi:ectoine hydroxylase-related dioxygenase (phytanoyl-CoA dioxygenase family)